MVRIIRDKILNHLVSLAAPHLQQAHLLAACENQGRNREESITKQHLNPTGR
jgi:hypothetical protein